jgi:hypothetical protein
LENLFKIICFKVLIAQVYFRIPTPCVLV